MPRGKKTKFSDPSHRQLNNLLMDCLPLSLPYIENPEGVKTVILYQVFFYSLLESGVLYPKQQLLEKTPGNEKITFPANFTLTNAEITQKYLTGFYLPDVYSLVYKYIFTHLADFPAYLLPGYFYETMSSFAIKTTNGKIAFVRDTSHIKANGLYYTPWETAENFVNGFMDTFLRENNDVSGVKILDLACGCGIFSMVVLNALSRHHEEKYESSLVKLSVLKNNLYCMDCDENALEITRFSLLLYALYDQKNIASLSMITRLCETLREKVQRRDILDEYRLLEADMPEYPDKFDIVMSNPPYISYYSRHSKLNPDLQKQMPQMKQNLVFHSKKKGRQNAIMFFIDFARKIAQPDAILAFIVDMSIHEKLFEELRDWALNNLTLIETRINIADFPGVNSGQSVIYLKNKKADTENSVTIADEKHENVISVFQEELKKRKAFFIRRNSRIMERLDSLPRIDQVCRISSGVNIGGVSDEFLYSNNTSGNFYPIINPGMISRPYARIELSNAMFMDFNREKAEQINKDAARQGKNNVIALGKLERFLAPRLFIRQSAPRILAAYCEAPAISPYSIFVANSVGNCSLFVLLAILNSDLVTYYSMQKGLIRQGLGKQPQIRKSALMELPAPESENYSRFCSKIENKVKHVLEDSRDEAVSDSLGNIEKMVCAMYEIEYEEFLAEKDINQNA